MCYCFIWFLSNLGPSPCSFQRSKWCSCRSGCSAFTVLCCLVWSLSWPEGQKQFLKDQFYSKGYYKPPPPSSSLCIQSFKLLMINSLSPKYLLVPLPPNKNLKRIIQFGIQWQCYSLGPVYILAQIKLYFKAGICCLWYSRNMITHILTLDESLQSSTHSPRN